MDYGSFCKTCTHRVSRVSEVKVLADETLSEDTFRKVVFWQSVDGNGTSFVRGVAQRSTVDGLNKITITTTFPEDYGTLEAEYGLSHNPGFVKMMKSTWTLTQIENDRVRIDYKVSASCSSLVCRFVRGGLKESSDEILAIVKNR